MCTFKFWKKFGKPGKDLKKRVATLFTLYIFLEQDK